MTFQEWLPTTKGNRVALSLALLSLVIFVVWNLLPYYMMGDSAREGIMASQVWSQVFSHSYYTYAMSTKDPDAVLGVIANLTVTLTGLMSILTIPLWRFLQASPFLRLPPAMITLAGGAVIVWFITQATDKRDVHPTVLLALCLIGYNMFAVSASLFVMRREPVRNPVADQYAPEASEKL
jgi:hypothetical protein